MAMQPLQMRLVLYYNTLSLANDPPPSLKPAIDKNLSTATAIRLVDGARPSFLMRTVNPPWAYTVIGVHEGHEIGSNV